MSRRLVEEQLDAILAALRDILGADLVGAYLHGSAALGGLGPHSDVDVLAVSSRPTERDEKRRLVDRLLALSGGERGRPVEVTIVVGSQIRPWRYPPSFDFQYGEWLRAEFERGEVEPWPTTTNPDLATLLTMVLRADEPLVGPPTSDVLDPVPPGDLTRAMVGEVGGLLRDLDGDTRNVLLTLSRMWSTLATGVIRPKDEAADWALARLPEQHRAVLARARAVYLGEEEDRWDDLEPALRPHVDYVVAEIDRLSADGR